MVALSPNEFIDRSDSFGLIQSEPDPQSSLAMEGVPIIDFSDRYNKEQISIKLELADVKRGNER